MYFAKLFINERQRLIVTSLLLGLAITPISAAESLRQAPEQLKPSAHGVGQLVDLISFTDIAGHTHSLSGTPAGIRLTAFCFTSTSCPLSRKYLPTLARLASEDAADVRYVLVNPVTSDNKQTIHEAASIAKAAIYVHDTDGLLTDRLGGLTTTDVIVVDAARTVVYHGAVDDQYGLGYSRDEPRHRYLTDAIDALLDGKRPSVAATNAPGCDIGFDRRRSPEANLTYHGKISRIIQQNCLECHRSGGIAPFSLETYDDLVAHAGMVETVVSNRTMPPWFATETIGKEVSPTAHHAVWANDRSLAESERDDLLAWLRSSQPPGEADDAPLPIKFPEEWQIGTPDDVWEFAKPMRVQATGIMPYQYVTIDTGLAESKWVQAIEVQPGNPEVVHHVIVTVREADESGTDAEDAEETNLWAAYVPGQAVWQYPDGFAKALPKNARLVFQMHYTPNGKATSDRTRIGVVYAETPPQHEVRVRGILNHRIRIPPQAARHREDASLRLPVDVTVLGFLPHMHLRGTACRYTVLDRDGNTETLLDIPRYDFNWQLLYRYAEPRPLHAGDALQFTAWYDNSANNPANPDPNETVRWGQQTFEEMMLGYVEYFLPDVPPGTQPARSFNPQRRQRQAPGNSSFLEAAFRRLDQNRDGQLSRDEVPVKLRPRFQSFDANTDGKLSLEEAGQFRR